MKPQWSDAPKWAEWLAMDGDGWWNWFELEPEWDGEAEWLLNASEDDSRYENASVNGPDESGIDWDIAWDTKEPKP